MLRVLVPSKTDALARSLVASMEESEPGSSSRAIFADNGLSVEFRHSSRSSFFDLARPFVFSKAINFSATLTHRDDDFLVMGDDAVVISRNWLSACESLLSLWPEDFGILNLAEPSTATTYSSEADLIEVSTAIGFSGTLIPRWVWKAIGTMDERFTGYGFDDIDYCLRVLHSGLKIGVTRAATIQHAGTSTYRREMSTGELNAATVLNHDLFREKWGMPLRPVKIEFLQAAPHLARSYCSCTNP